MRSELDEYDLGEISTVLYWMGRSGTSVGMSTKRGARYEFDSVPDSVWKAWVAAHDRALAWSRSRRYEAEKPRNVSLFGFYKDMIEDLFPRWTVDNETGHCSPNNDLARAWEAQHGPRGTTRLHLYRRNGIYRRHGHYGNP